MQYNMVMNNTADHFAHIALYDCSVFEDRPLFEAVFSRMDRERQEKILALRREEDRCTSLGAGFLAACLLEDYRLSGSGPVCPAFRDAAARDGTQCTVKGRTQSVAQEGAPWLVRHDDSGRPVIKDTVGRTVPLYLSLSHSGKYAMAGLSSMPVGVDIERRKVPRMEVAERFYSESEKKYLQQAADKTSAFYEIWCKKECRIKADGFRDLRELPVFPVPDGTSFHEYPVAGYSCFVYIRALVKPRLLAFEPFRQF